MGPPDDPLPLPTTQNTGWTMTATTPRVRVTYITTYPTDSTAAITGPQRVMRDVIRAVAETGADVEVWSSPYRRTGCRRSDATDGDVRVHFVGPLSLIGVALQDSDAVMHIGSFSYFHALPVLARRILSRFRKMGPIIYTAHGVVAIEARFGARAIPVLTPIVERFLLRSSDKIIVLSNQMTELIGERYQVPAGKIEVIGPTAPIDVADASPLVPDLVTTKPFFIYAGEFRTVKAMDILIRALSRLHLSATDRPWTMYLAGTPYPSWRPPPGWAELVGLGRIRRLGSLGTSELTAVYKSAVCLVLPSRYEPYGMAVLETMSTGTPAIVSDRVGARDLITDGVSGFVVPYGDVAALSAAMATALDDPKAIAEMGAAARTSVLSRSRTDVIARYLETYRP